MLISFLQKMKNCIDLYIQMYDCIKKKILYIFYLLKKLYQIVPNYSNY